MNVGIFVGKINSPYVVDLFSTDIQHSSWLQGGPEHTDSRPGSQVQCSVNPFRIDRGKKELESHHRYEQLVHEFEAFHLDLSDITIRIQQQRISLVRLTSSFGIV